MEDPVEVVLLVEEVVEEVVAKDLPRRDCMILSESNPSSKDSIAKLGTGPMHPQTRVATAQWRKTSEMIP